LLQLGQRQATNAIRWLGSVPAGTVLAAR
jgi:hypothetical protein